MPMSTVLTKNHVNLLSLALIQGSNAVVPLLIFPYLYSVLGDNEFSIVVVSESVSLYVLAFCLYGFDITGVRSLLEFGESPSTEYTAQVYWTILVTRLIILVLASMVMLVVAYLYFAEYLSALVCWLMFPLGVTLQSNYFFQAKENNFKFSCVVFLSRLSACILVLAFSNTESDGLISIAFVAGSYLASGLIAVAIVSSKYPFNFSYISLDRIEEAMKSGFAMFIGGLSVSLFRGSNIIVLSIVSNPAAVSLYAIAEKIIKSFQAVAMPMNQLAQPKLIRAYQNSSYKTVFKTVWEYTRLQIYGMLILAPIFLGFLYFIVSYRIMSGINFHIFTLIAVMVLAVFFGISNYMFGTVGLNLMGRQGYYAKIVLITGIVSVIVAIVLGYFFGEFGAAVAFVFGELFLLMLILLGYSNSAGLVHHD